MKEEGSNQDIRTYNSSGMRLYPGTAGTADGGSTTGLSNYSPNKRINNKTVLETDQTFNKEMKETIDNLKRMPAFKNKVWNRVTELHNRIEDERGEAGIQAGEIFRQRL